MGRKKRERKAHASRPRLAVENAPRTVTLVVRWCIYPLLLTLLAVGAYANSFQAPFVLDDEVHIVNEKAIRPPFLLDKMLGTTRPAVTASLALNYAFGKLDVWGYHLLNLIAHIACGIVLYGFTRYTLRLPVLGERFGAAADHLAVAVAALFLLHPIQTEAVTYVIQRSEIFAALALLGGLWTAALAARAGASWPHLVALVAIGVFGLLSKPLVVVLPLLFALYDWCFIAQGRVDEMARRWRIYLLLLGLTGSAAVAGWWRATEATGLGQTAGFAVKGIDAWRYLTWQFGVVLYYLRLIVLPDRLCFDCGYYSPWPVLHSVIRGAVWLPLALLAASAVAAALARRRHPLVTFAALGSAIVLAPTSGVIPLADVYVEHRLYLPIGLLAMSAVGLVVSAGEAAGRRGWLPPTAARSLLVAGLVAACGALAVMTVARNGIYSDPLRLWQDSVAKAPENDRAHYYLGREYARRGQREMASQHFRETNRRNAYMALGVRYLELAKYPEAIEIFEWVRARRPKWSMVHQHLASAYQATGRMDEAVASAERAVALDPENATSRKLLAELYAQVGRVGEASRE